MEAQNRNERLSEASGGAPLARGTCCARSNNKMVVDAQWKLETQSLSYIKGLYPALEPSIRDFDHVSLNLLSRLRLWTAMLCEFRGNRRY